MATIDTSALTALFGAQTQSKPSEFEQVKVYTANDEWMCNVSFTPTTKEATEALLNGLISIGVVSRFTSEKTTRENIKSDSIKSVFENLTAK